MRGTWLLARAGLRVYRVRSLLAALAVASATSLLCLTLGAHRAVDEQGLALAHRVLGRFDAVVAPEFALDPRLPPRLAAELRADPAVADVHVVRAQRVRVSVDAGVTYLPNLRSWLVATDAADAPFTLRAGAWLPGRSPADAVLAGGLADRWQKRVGDPLTIEGDGGEFTLTVAGVTDELMSHELVSGVYVRPDVAARVGGGRAGEERLLIDLRDGAADAAFAARHRARLAAGKPPALLHDRGSVAAAFGVDRAFGDVAYFGYAAAGLAMVSAAFIVTATLTAGVDERSRQFAVLRSIGASRGKLFAVVLTEGAILGVAGAACGAALGVAWLQVAAAWRRDLFPGGIWPGPATLLLSATPPLIAALAASLWPAVRAARVPAGGRRHPTGGRRGGRAGRSSSSRPAWCFSSPPGCCRRARRGGRWASRSPSSSRRAG